MVRSVTAPSDDVVVPRPESYVSPDDYEPDGPVEIEVALPGSPPPRESLSFSAHYDDVSCTSRHTARQSAAHLPL